MLGAADTCQLRAQYTLDRPDWVVKTAGISPLVGTGYHAGLELYYRERMEDPGALPELPWMIEAGRNAFDSGLVMDAYDSTPIEKVLWSDKIPDVETAHKMIEACLTEYVEGKHYWPHDLTVHGVEFNATVQDPIAGEAKLGADLLLIDPNGWLVLVDHKTAGRTWDSGKHHPRKNNQAALYQRLARQVFPEAPGYRFVFDVMTLPSARKGPSFERRISDPEPIHEEAIAKKAASFRVVYETVHEKMGLDLPANPASTLCNEKWCDFWHGCPYGAGLDT